MNVKAGYPSPRRKPILHKQMRPLHKARRIFKGTLVLITNTTDISPAEAVARDKGLDGIARGFRVLKADIVIAPLLHRLPDRIRAHALIRFLALTLCRVMPLGLTTTAQAQAQRPSRRFLPRCNASPPISARSRLPEPLEPSPSNRPSSKPLTSQGLPEPPGVVAIPEIAASEFHCLPDVLSNPRMQDVGRPVRSGLGSVHPCRGPVLLGRRLGSGAGAHCCRPLRPGYGETPARSRQTAAGRPVACCPLRQRALCGFPVTQGM